MNTLMTPAKDEMIETVIDAVKILDDLPFGEKVEAINRIREAIHERSPFKDEPVDYVKWVPYETVHGNDYNPNTVAPPEMRLLKRSVDEDGYTQPIVAWESDDDRTVVDGFHRWRIGTETKGIRKRLHGHLPITCIRHERDSIKDRMASTIRHNRARGVHGVVPMTDIVAEMIRQGCSDADVCKKLGMDADELLRFKQTSGLPSLFTEHEYNRAWE